MGAQQAQPCCALKGYSRVMAFELLDGVAAGLVGDEVDCRLLHTHGVGFSVCAEEAVNP
jgi:hypothetical protein